MRGQLCICRGLLSKSAEFFDITTLLKESRCFVEEKSTQRKTNSRSLMKKAHTGFGTTSRHDATICVGDQVTFNLDLGEPGVLQII